MKHGRIVRVEYQERRRGRRVPQNGAVAKLVHAHALGACVRKDLQVRVLLAPLAGCPQGRGGATPSTRTKKE